MKSSNGQKVDASEFASNLRSLQATCLKFAECVDILLKHV